MTILNYSSSKQIPWSCPWCRVRCNHCIGRPPSHPAQVSETNMFPFTKITAHTFLGGGSRISRNSSDMGLFSLRILIIGWPKNEGLEEDHFFSGLLAVMCLMNIQLPGFPITFYVPWCMTIQPSQFTQGWQGVCLAIARSQGRHPGMWNLCGKPVNCGVIVVVMIYTGVTGFCGPTPDMSMYILSSAYDQQVFLEGFFECNNNNNAVFVGHYNHAAKNDPTRCLVGVCSSLSWKLSCESWVSMIPWGVGLVDPSLKWPAELDELWDFRSLNCLSPSWRSWLDLVRFGPDLDIFGLKGWGKHRTYCTS